MYNIILIGGENPVFIKEELEKIIKNTAESDRTIYYGDELNTEELFFDLMTGSLFSTHRTILIHSADKAETDFEKKLLEYFKNPSDSVTLILEYQKIPAKVINGATDLGNQRAIIHNFKKAWAQDQKRYIHRRLADQSINIAQGVDDLLISYAGEDIQEVSAMLDKLISFLGNQKHIDEKDIHKVLERAHNASIFDLIDAIFSHNRTRALSCLHDLLYANESFPAITAMFYRATKIMWAVKTSKNGSMPEGLSVSPYEWKKYQNFSSKNNLKFLSSCFSCIHTLEIESKSKAPFFSQTTLEKFLCEL